MNMRTYNASQRISLLLLAFLAATVNAGPEPYTFGDDMLKFVREEAATAVRLHMDNEYGARSLNGFEVTLDKARHTANQSFAALTASDKMLADAQKLLEVAKEAEASPSGLSQSSIAEMASLCTELHRQAEVLALQAELVPAALRTMSVLPSPMNKAEFKSSPLRNVPLFFVLSSTGDEQEFNYQISLEVTVVSSGNADNENATRGGFFLFDLWKTMADRQKHERQIRKFEQALRLLPSVLPGDDETYASYAKGFAAADEIFGKEVVLLKPQLENTHRAVIERFEALDAARATLLNILLSDRVRSGFDRLRVQDLSRPEHAAAVREAAFSLTETRGRLNKLLQVAKTSGRKAQVFSSLEDIQDSAAAVSAFVDRITPIPIYRPLTPHLQNVRTWFSQQADWATTALLSGASSNITTDKSLLLPQDAAESVWADLTKMQEIPINLPPSLPSQLIAEVSTDFELSLSTHWPEGGGSGPHHSGYPRGGGDVWARGTDGAFARDARNPGGGRVEAIRQDLRNRTTRNDARYADAIVQSRAAAGRRQAEVTQYSTRVGQVAQLTRNARASIPGRAAPLSDYARERAKPRELDERHRRMDTGYSVKLSVERARQDLLMTRDDINPNDPKVKDYRRLHGEYLKAAEVYSRRGHPVHAEEFLYSAISLRAWLRGYETTSIHLAAFNPLRPVQTVVETLGQKFPLEKPGGPEDIDEDRIITERHPMPDRIAACNRRSAEVLELLYGYAGFHNPSRAVVAEVGPNGIDHGNEDGRPVLRAQGILRYVTNHSEEWRHIGNGTSGDALSEAQRFANLGVAVIAVSVDHVAVVLPGELRYSGSFGNYVPNIYNSVVNHPENTRSFYYGPLSRAWKIPSEVQFFALWDRP